MNNQTRILTASLFLFVILTVWACGGGGGGGGASSASRPPVAPDPTCSALVTRQSSVQAVRPYSSDPGILVPATSIEQQSDIGKRVHTNHLISISGVHTMVSGPGGLSPVQVATAYGVTNFSGRGAGAIAIVDAYNYPTALNDFNNFSQTYSLPTESSGSATSASNSVFQVVYAAGRPPANDGGWSEEMAIDIQWAHAMAPMAKIYLVEAASSTIQDISQAVAVAKSLPGVHEVSTSFGATETGCTYVDYNSFFVQSGVVFFSAAGDSAGERSFPAESVNTVAVGGTSLAVSPIGTWLSESVWNGTGCGPSAFEPRPVYQDSIYSTVGRYRAGCDIAAVADPNTGVSVYDSFAYQGVSGWFVAGGTSVACPIVAGIVNGSGVVFDSSQAFNRITYSQAGSQYFHAITSGRSGGYQAGTPWCFPTGLGTPNGLSNLLGGS